MRIVPSSYTKRALIIPDCHIPYQDEAAYNLMLRVAKDFRPNEVVILGDFADFYSVNLHGKSPNQEHILNNEIIEVNKKLGELSMLFKKARKVFIVGNHEHRLERYIEQKAPELFNTTTLEKILSLKSFKVVPYSPNQKYNVLGTKLIARHEPLAGGNYAARSTVAKAMKSVIFGHIHSIQEHQVVTIDGENHRGISCGWLGDSSHKVMQYVKGHHQWTHGFSLVTVHDGDFFNETVHIINGKCRANGRIYS